MSTTAIQPTAPAAAEVQHKPWCNEHTDPEVGCSRAVGTFFNLDGDPEGLVIHAYGDGQTVTPTEARKIAAELEEAARIVEVDVVVRGGVPDIEGTTLADLLRLAREHGVRPSAVVAAWEQRGIA